MAAYNDFDKLSWILGHTSSEMSLQYTQGIPQADGLAYFEIRPP